MPEGPFGFRRLTSLGPFVEPDKIHPNHDTPPGTYGLIDIREVQPETAMDTSLFLAEGEMAARDIVAGVAVFKYKEIILGELLDNSDFSATLTKYVERDPDDLADRVESRDIPDKDAKSLCLSLQFDDNKRNREECARKVKEDIERVEVINEKIRDSREYFPPTTFPLESDGDTIDGAHRIVALASIIGTEEEIWVWELQNEGEVTQELKDVGIIR